MMRLLRYAFLCAVVHVSGGGVTIPDPLSPERVLELEAVFERLQELTVESNDFGGYRCEIQSCSG